MDDHPTPTPNQNVGPLVVAQVDGIDVTPGYWSEDPWEDDRSIEVNIPEGQDPATPLAWCYAAGVLLVPDEDAVEVVIVLPDSPAPFAMRIRRLPDGRLVLNVPHPGLRYLPAPLYQLAPGTYQVRDAVRTEDLQ